jgi:hypothetical protein
MRAIVDHDFGTKASHHFNNGFSNPGIPACDNNDFVLQA